MICKWIKNLFKKEEVDTNLIFNIYDKFYDKAKIELGITEISGKFNNERILEYHATTSLKVEDDETPWCSSFVNFIVTKCGVKGTNSARARSWLKWGIKLDSPVQGCVVVLWRGSPGSSSGHVGFYSRESSNPDYIYILGGNQGNKVSVAKYPKLRVLGYRGVEEKN